jgi:hypothetical protein
MPLIGNFRLCSSRPATEARLMRFLVLLIVAIMCRQFLGGMIIVKPDKTLNRIILEVVEKQIRQHNPPATKKTLDRLVREGISEGEARRLIGCVVASEMFDVLREQKPFDEDRFTKALEKLPALPE